MRLRTTGTIALCFWLVAVAISCGFEGHGDRDQRVDRDHEEIVTEELCGGCDPDCHIITDTPIREEDVVIEGDEINGEAVLYDEETGGVIIGTAHGYGSDSDGDGLPDNSDPTPEDPHGDVDGDGVPDAYETYLGTDPTEADPPPPDDHWYFVLSEDGGPVWRDIPPDIPLSVRSADVYFLVDVTGSMGGEIDNLADRLTSYIIPNIQIDIEDVHFGVGRFGDFPEWGGSDEPFVNLVNITDDVDAVQDAINGLDASGGADGPESQTAALHAVATGEGLDTSCNGQGPTSCPEGHTGYPCFRPGAQPIIILFTDNSFHNGVIDTIYGDDCEEDTWCYECGEYICTWECQWKCSWWYGCWCDERVDYTYGDNGEHCAPLSPAVPSLETVVEEINDIGARVIGVYSGYYPSDEDGPIATWSSGYRSPLRYPDGLDDMLDLYYTSLETETVDANGYPFVYKIDTDGSGLDAEVVGAVSDLVELMLLQVNSRWNDTDPAAPDGSVLIQDVDPVSCSNCGVIDHAANIAHDVYPGSNVTFQVHLENTAIPPGPEPQEFELRIEILNNDTALLAERTVHVLVPGEVGFNAPVDTGRYWQTWDGRRTCNVDGKVPSWSQLYFDATTPPGTDVSFVVRTSETFAGLEAATPVTVGHQPGDESPLSIEGELEAAGVANGQRYLRLEAVLHTDDLAISPTLHESRTVFYCVDAE